MVESYPDCRSMLLADFYKLGELLFGLCVVGVEVTWIYPDLLHHRSNSYGCLRRKVDVGHKWHLQALRLQAVMDCRDMRNIGHPGNCNAYKFRSCVNHAAAFFGSLAGVKPIGEFDSNGMTTVLGKAVGAKAAFKTLIDYMAATEEKIEDQIIFIAETNRLPQAEAFKKLIEERFKPKEVLITDVCPTCGVNVGPGLMAAYYMGKPISADLSEERAIIEKSLAAK